MNQTSERQVKEIQVRTEDEARRQLKKDIFNLKQEIKSGKLKKREIKKVTKNVNKAIAQTNSGLEQEAKQLKTQMTKAQEQDQLSIAKREPALAKLGCVEEACQLLSSPTFADRFVDCGGMEVVAKWLQPTTDGTYPNALVVRPLIQCMLRMELTCDSLASAQLPSLVTPYADAKTGHSRDVQRLAQQLKFKWQKLLFSD